MYQPFPPAQPQTPAPRGVSLRWGLIAAGVILLLNAINIFGRALGIGAIILIVNLLLLGVAGLLASRETGKVSTGVIAGLIAGAIGFLDFYAVDFYQTVSNNTSFDPGAYLAGALFAVLLFEGLTIGLGAGLGAIGGLIGRAIYASSHPQPAQAFMPPMPSMPGAYGAPPMYPPGYPAQPSGAYPQQYPPAAPYPPGMGSQASGAYLPAYPPQYPPQVPYPPAQENPQYPPQYPQG